MSWIIFSLLAALIWAVANTIDKYVLTKWIKNPYIPVIVFIIVGFFSALVILFFQGIQILTVTQLLLVFLTGAFTISNLIFYLKAVQIAEISRIIPFFSLGPLFVAILGAIFLGEVFSETIYLGILFLVVGSWLISSKNFHEISLGKAAFFMLLSSFGFAVQIVLVKYLLNFTDNWTIFAYIRIALIPFLVIFLILNWKDFVSIFKKPRSGVFLSALFSSRIIGIIAYLALYLALSLGYATLVESLAAVQPLFVLIIAVGLSLVYPNIIKEEIGRKSIITKSIATVLMICGAVIVAL